MIAISTHLPPPVMMESTEVFEPTTIMLCCSCAICFSAAACSENDQGSMNFDFEHRPGLLDQAVQGRGHPDHRRMELAGLPLADPMAGMALVPGAIELLGGEPELNNQLAG